MKLSKLYRIHCIKAALYSNARLWIPNDTDDEEVLAELCAYSATLTPLV